jgi:hypothetical protein
VGDDYARLLSWWTQGGFADEYGKRHETGNHHKVDYWEVLNEIDLEHNNTPETYTHRYDAVVAALHKAQPQMKFVALALAFPSQSPHHFDSFLNPKNYKPGTPMGMISSHFYASPKLDENPTGHPPGNVVHRACGDPAVSSLGHAGDRYPQQSGKPLGCLRMEPHEDGQPVNRLPPQCCMNTLFGIHWHNLWN